MNNTVKFLIGAGVTAVGVATMLYCSKKAKEKKAQESIDISEEAVKRDHKDDSIIERIKTAAYKKAVKILAWVVIHKDQIEAFSVIVGVVSGIFTVINAVKDFVNGAKMQANIQWIIDHELEFRDVWNNKAAQDTARYEAIMAKLNDIHLDMGMIHEIQEMLVKPIRKKGA